MATTDKFNTVKYGSKTATFQDMINKFGVVTVMNAKVYEGVDFTTAKTPNAILAECTNPLCELKTLKVANVTTEGPTKTITGGQYASPLLKFGKTARLEMQDALGSADALEAFGAALKGYNVNNNVTALHFSEEFTGPKTIIGESFFIDQATGRQVDVKIIFYQFLPDSIFNFTQDSEGDATVFDLNGDLIVTDVKLVENGTDIEMGLFYSIIDPSNEEPYYTSTTESNGSIKITPKSGYQVKVDNGDASDSDTIPAGNAARVQIVKDSVTYVDTVIKNY